MNFSHTDITQAHSYGIFHGVYISIVVLIALYAISYYVRPGKSARNIAHSLAVVAVTFFFYGLYGVFFEQTHQSITTSIFSDNYFWLVKFSAPLALLTSTYVFIRYIAPLSLDAYQLINKHRLLVSLLYALDIAVFIALFFIQQINHASLLILLSFLPHTLASLFYFYVALKEHFGLLLTAVYTTLLILISWLIWQYIHGGLHLTEATYIGINAYACLMMIIIAFVALRYGYDTATRFMHLDEIDNKKIMHDIYTAIEEKQFYMEYQPKQNLADDKICGFEAFVRWKHPEHGIIPPNEFIEIAEHSRQIDDLFAYTLKQTIKDTKALYETGLKLPISLNFSSKNLSCHNAELVLETLKQYELPTDILILELTESILLTLSPETNKALAMLHFAGIKLSLDDYGTGYSSLGYLHKLKVHEIKIDKSFISEIEHNDYHQVIVESVIYMAKRLGIEVVAEGVESVETKEVMKQKGCDIIQGFLLSKPMTKYELYDYLSQKGLLHTEADHATIESINVTNPYMSRTSANQPHPPKQ